MNIKFCFLICSVFTACCNAFLGSSFCLDDFASKHKNQGVEDSRVPMDMLNVDSVICRVREHPTPEGIASLFTFVQKNELKLAEKILLHSLTVSKGDLLPPQQRIINFLLANNYEGECKNLSCYKNVPIVFSEKKSDVVQLLESDMKIVEMQRKAPLSFAEGSTEDKIVKFLDSLE